MTSTEESSLESNLALRGFEFSNRQRGLLKAYCGLLWEANQKLNMTRHTDYSTFVARDLLDVMQLSPFLAQEQEILDIGSGGGVPGLVLSIVRPDLQVSVCESVGKKAVVLEQMARQLELPVTVHHDRAEKVLDDLRFHCCTARAVGPMWKLLTWLQDRWLHAHRLLTFKGPRWVSEVSEAKTRGLTKGLIIKPICKYPLVSTDPEAPPLESLIIEVRRAIR